MCLFFEKSKRSLCKHVSPNRSTSHHAKGQIASLHWSSFRRLWGSSDRAIYIKKVSTILIETMNIASNRANLDTAAETGAIHVMLSMFGRFVIGNELFRCTCCFCTEIVGISRRPSEISSFSEPTKIRLVNDLRLLWCMNVER